MILKPGFDTDVMCNVEKMPGNSIDAHHTAAANVIRDQPKVAIRRYKGENSVTLPFLVSEKNSC